MRHFLSLLDFSGEEFMDLLDRADELRSAWTGGWMPRSLAGLRVGLWFFGNGFRNRLAFEIGARAMGADVSYIPGELGEHEPLKDIGRYLGNWFHLLVVRARKHEDLEYLAETAGVPVINARTDFNHPCEIMGDLQYARTVRRSLDGLRVVFVGETTNLCSSWFAAAARLPISVIQVCPREYAADQSLLDSLASAAVGEIRFETDLDDALERADILYTDCWPSSEDPRESELIREAFLPYQITARRLDRLHESALFLPCPPVSRGREVSADAMDSPFCRNHEAKTFLLHAQNAVMETLVKQSV